MKAGFLPVWFTPVLLACSMAFQGCTPSASAPAPSPGKPRVISLAPNLTEIICAIGGAEHLAGRSSACDYPPQIVQTIPVVGDFGVPSLERILATKAETVIYTDLADASLDLKLRRVGLRPEKVPCSRLHEIPAAITRVGTLLGREAEATRLARELQTQLDTCRTVPASGRKPKILVLIWNDPLTAVGRNTFISDLVNMAGGQNVGDEIDRDYFQVSREWVLARDPDVILCFFMASDRPVRQVVMNMPGWETLRAVRAKRVYDGFDNNLVVRPGPRVMQGLNLIRPYIRIDSAAELGQTPPQTP